MDNGTLYRLAAFAAGDTGGNPAGVWVGEELPDAQTMQKIAADVGYSETSFVSPATGINRTVRYYSPVAEVSFCGHATIAAGVVLGRISGDNTYIFATAVGEVPVTVRSDNGLAEASLVSVEPKQAAASETLVTATLELLGWNKSDLDTAIPPMIANAGAWHLVLAAREASRLATLDYDFEQMKSLMLKHDLTTLQLVWRERDDLFHSRNPFPVGGVVEDPATGASAAALGGYLRDSGILKAPATFVIRQGEAMGSPCRLTVEVPEHGGIIVSGSAIDI